MLTTNPTHPLVSLLNPTHHCGVKPRSKRTLGAVVEVAWYGGGGCGATSGGDDCGGVRVAVTVAEMVVVVWCGCGDDSSGGCHGVAAWC
ncbi:hypothetical protein Tco_0540448 [Tanacetum coccineum]